MACIVMYSKEPVLEGVFSWILTFEQHILEKVKKANQTMGLIRRSFTYLVTQNFRWLFKAMTRPHLEYAQSAWSPFRKKEIVTIENVQRRATKMILGLKEVSYKERLKKLDLLTLVYRRIWRDIIEVYKMLNGRYDQDAEMKPSSHPEYVVEVPSIKSFERRLDQFWADRPMCFDHESHTMTTRSRDKLSRLSEYSDLDI